MPDSGCRQGFRKDAGAPRQRRRDRRVAECPQSGCIGATARPVFLKVFCDQSTRFSRNELRGFSEGVIDVILSDRNVPSEGSRDPSQMSLRPLRLTQNLAGSFPALSAPLHRRRDAAVKVISRERTASDFFARRSAHRRGHVQVVRAGRAAGPAIRTAYTCNCRRGRRSSAACHWHPTDKTLRT